MEVYSPVDMVNMWTDSKRVHPVPESPLLSGLALTERETRRDKGKPLRHRMCFTCVDMVEGVCVCERDYSSMLTLQIPVLVLWFGESRVFVEECGNEGHVELCISTHDIRGGYKLSAFEAVGLFQHTVCSHRKIFLLVTHTDKHTRPFIFCAFIYLSEINYNQSSN